MLLNHTKFQNALLLHEHTPKDVCATHTLHHRRHFVLSHMPDLRQTLLQFIDVMNLTGVANVSVHASTPKEDILAFNVTQEYTNN